MATLMVLIAIGTFGLGMWVSGVGPEPYLVVDAIIPVVVVPAALVMIGVSPSRFASAFRIAVRPGETRSDELAAARNVLRGFSRMVGISVALFVSIGVIAIIHDLPTSGIHPLTALLTGGGTLIVDVLYALILQALVIQPLMLRLDLAILGSRSE
ncbi:MAG: hypothetical protein R6U25_13305 [Alkalispirochaeta sp.]